MAPVRPAAARGAAPLLWILLSSISCLAAPAQAGTFAFGPITHRADLTVDLSSGDAEDQASSQFAWSTASTANLRAQASADILGLESAVADVSYVWDVPYTITRNVEISACCPGAAVVTVPVQVVYFTLAFSGAAAIDEFGGHEEAQIFDGISVSSLGGLFSDVSFLGGSRSNSDGSTAIFGSDVAYYATTTDFSGAGAGEISATIPTDYRSWQDLEAPHAVDYGVAQTLTQSFMDTLRVSFRLRAESRPSGSVSTTAGEAMACAGLQSTLDSFDTQPNCGSGLTLQGAVGDFDFETFTVTVPEPGTLALVLSGASLLALLRRERRAR